MNRTPTQNNALHLGFNQVSKVCLDHGVSLRAVVQNLDVPVTPIILKDMYKSIAKAMYNVESTTQLNRQQISEVWNVFIKPIEERTGEYMPFPSEEATDNYLNSFTT